MQKNISDFFSLNPGQPNKNPTPNMNPHSAPVMKATQDILRLPTHTRGLWGFSKPLLVGIANAALPTVESILEVICKLIVECRIIQSRDLDISVLSEYLSINDSSQMMQTFKNIAGYALEVEYLFVEVIFT